MTHSVWRLFLVGLCVAVLAGCGLPQPFRHRALGVLENPLVELRSGVGVTVPPVEGAPLPIDRMIALDVAAALRDRAEIPAMATVDPAPQVAGMRLLGRVQQARLDEGVVTLTLDWRLVDAEGTLLEDRVQTLGVSAVDWLNLDPAVSEQVAAQGSGLLARLIQGDPATIDPSRNDLAAAAVEPAASMGAEDTDAPARDGYGEGGQPGSSPPPARDGSDSTSPDAGAARVVPGPPPPPAEPARPVAVAPSLLVMAPPQVTEAPGDGRTSLAAALTRLLKLNDVRITEKSIPGRFHVLGAVTVDAADDPTRQRVSLLWRVLTEDGGELGRLSQENEIPAGLLDGAWGDTAYAVAEAALMGVGEILVRKAAVTPPAGGGSL